MLNLARSALLFFFLFTFITSVLTIGCFQQANVKSPSCSLYNEATVPHNSHITISYMGQGSMAEPQCHLVSFPGLCRERE